MSPDRSRFGEERKPEPAPAGGRALSEATPVISVSLRRGLGPGTHAARWAPRTTRRGRCTPGSAGACLPAGHMDRPTKSGGGARTPLGAPAPRFPSQENSYKAFSARPFSFCLFFLLPSERIEFLQIRLISVLLGNGPEGPRPGQKVPGTVENAFQPWGRAPETERSFLIKTDSLA